MCVEKLNVSINCEDATPGEVEKAEAAVRSAVNSHPNHLTLEMTRYAEDKMMLSDHQQQPGNEISNVAAEEGGASPACMQPGNEISNVAAEERGARRASPACMRQTSGSGGSFVGIDRPSLHASPLLHPISQAVKIGTALAMPFNKFPSPSRGRSCSLYFVDLGAC